MNPQVQAIIEQIQRLDQEGAEIDDLIKAVEELVRVAPVSFGSKHHPGVSLYRATNHHRSLPTRVEELWYPPAEKTPLGRANRAGRPIFYCSSDPGCAMLEVRTTVGRFVVLATWVTTQEMILHDIGYSTQVLERAGAKRDIPELHRKFYSQQLDDTARHVRDFIGLAFTDRTSLRYRLTTAIAEFHLQGDEFAGILYPSVMKNANTDNMALQTKFVHSGLRLTGAQLILVDKVLDDFNLEGTIKCDLENVGSDGALTWKWRDEGVTVLPLGSHPVHVGNKLLIRASRSITVGAQNYHLEPGYLYTMEITEHGALVRDMQGNIVEPTS